MLSIILGLCLAYLIWCGIEGKWINPFKASLGYLYTTLIVCSIMGIILSFFITLLFAPGTEMKYEPTGKIIELAPLSEECDLYVIKVDDYYHYAYLIDNIVLETDTVHEDSARITSGEKPIAIEYRSKPKSDIAELFYLDFGGYYYVFEIPKETL